MTSVCSAKDLELFRKATAGTVSDGGLIQLSNYASDLGISLKDQALLFSLAEDAADKYGGTVPENFERVINATDGSAKGLRAVGLSVKQYNDELEKLLPTSVKTIEDLDAETQQAIRLQAILNLTGVTIDDVNKKQQSNADVIANLGILYDTFATNVGLAVNESTSLKDSLPGLTSVTVDLGKAFGTLISDVATAAGELKSFLQDALYSYLEFTNNLTERDKDVRDQARIDARINVLEQQDEEKKAFRMKGDVLGEQKTKPGSPISKGGSTSREKTAVDKIEKTAQEIYIAKLYEIAERLKYSLGQPQTPGLPNKMQGFSIIDLESISGKVQSGKNEDISSTLLADSETIYQNISSLMNVLNIGTDTFVSKLLAGFGAAYQVLGIVGSILSFIPGGGVISKAFGARSSGGMVNAGQTYLTGERGIELFTPSVSGMIHNNSQTNKLMNQSLNKSNPINVYVSSNIDQRYLKVGIEKYNANQKYIRA